MAKEKTVLTTAEYDAWLSPNETLEMLSDLGTRSAKGALFARLTQGLLKGAVKTLKIKNQSQNFALILPHVWEPMATGWVVSDMWNTADIIIPHRASSAAYGYNTVDFYLFGVRFDPDGVRELLPTKATKSSLPLPHKQTAQATPAEADSNSGPPVAQSYLDAWHELYRKVYTGASDTEETALQSAQGMFPGKSVTRAKIRALRGKQKRGPKPKDGE